MILFFRLIWPRSWQSLTAWAPLITVGAVSCAGLSLALGLGFGFYAQQNTATLRDGYRGLPPRTQAVEGPLRGTDLFATGYGPLVVTTFVGDAGQPLYLPGLPKGEPSGTVKASPAVLAQFEDDWTGEIGVWLGDRTVEKLPDAALAHPRELVIVEFMDVVPPGLERKFYPVVAGRGYPSDSSFVILGLLVLVLPSVAVARAGAAVHLDGRARRYGLLRVLGMPPRQLAAVIAADMAVPLLAGALAGAAAYAALMSSWGSFTLAGSSYWTKDLLLPVALAAAIPLVTASVGLASVARMAWRAGRDPVGTLRRDRPGGVSYLTYLSAAGLLAGPAAVFAAAGAEFTLSVWLILGGLLLSVVGLGGLSRLAVTVSGRALAGRTRALVAGSRMSRSGGDALLGVSATAVAVLLIVFVVYANFDRLAPPVGDFDVFVAFEEETGSAEATGGSLAAYDGAARVVRVGRIPARVNFERTSVYTMTCADVPGSVKLDGAPCASGLIYLAGPSEEAVVSVTADPLPGAVSDPPADAIAGAYPVGGQVAASWIMLAGRPVLIVDEQPPAEYGVLLVTTDGTTESLRRVMQDLRARPGVNELTTRAALTSGVTEDTLIFNPYLLVMAVAAAGMGTVALLYAVLLLFRQRQAEFRTLRAQGATKVLLAVDLGLLFAVPLVIAFGLAFASGLVLAATYNASFGLPTPHGATQQVVSVLATMVTVSMTATVLVAVRAARISPLLTDPDAAAA